MGIFFSLYICPCMIWSKEKIICKEIKSKKNQNAFKYSCKRVSRRCWSYKMYLEGDSPHQAVIIVCELNWFFHISNHHNIRNLCNLAMFSHTTCKNSLLLLKHVHVQCNLAITRNTCVNAYSLNCLDSFLKNKIG